MQDLIVLSQKQQCILAEVVFGRVVPVRKLDLPAESVNTITDNGLIVSIGLSKPMLRVITLDNKLLCKHLVSGYNRLNVKGNTVYLGGAKRSIKGDTEMFGILNLDNPDFIVSEQELPIEPIIGKAIDDVLIVDNRLVLVDNIIFPKYLFEYDISEPVKPVLTKTVDLPNNGTYEHIVKGDMNENWLVLYSKTVGMAGSSQFITLEGFNRQGSIVTRWSSRTEEADVPYSFMDIGIAGNKLYILRSDGLFAIDLTYELSQEYLHEPIVEPEPVFKEKVNRFLDHNLMKPVPTAMKKMRCLKKSRAGSLILVGGEDNCEYEVISSGANTVNDKS